ncbi:tetratricopeptide repeat protein [Caulobacter segnis]
MFSLPLPLLGLSMLFSIALCVHAVRTGQQMYWLWIILAFQPVGGVVYLVAVLGPQFWGGKTARNVGAAARKALDPQREYREAAQAVDDAPTVANRVRMAVAATELGKHAEAEKLYADSLTGMYADDAQLLLGRANALIELNRPNDALPLLEKLGEQPNAGRTPHTMLALGRVYHALGREEQAETALTWAADHYPGFEGIARYTVFLARMGRKDEAREKLAEIDKRLSKTHSHFRKEAKGWRDFAAQAVG